jgi:hypothetical protein
MERAKQKIRRIFQFVQFDKIHDEKFVQFVQFVDKKKIVDNILNILNILSILNILKVLNILNNMSEIQNNKLYDIAGADRMTATQTIIAPPDWAGDSVDVYLAFISEDNREIANSVHVGSITVA